MQHRKIITYKTDSTSDFAALREAIVQRIKALRETERRIEVLAELPVKPTEGLSSHEVVALVTIARTVDVPGGNVAAHLVKQDCQRAGYTQIAVTLALRGLLRKNLIESGTDYDERGNESWPIFRATDAGLDWLEANQTRLVLRRTQKNEATEATGEDVPF